MAGSPLIHLIGDRSRTYDQTTTRRTAIESISRVIPLNSILMPTSVPTTHAALDGQVLQIITARTSVTMPSNNNHPLPDNGRSWNDRTDSSTPSIKR